MDKRPSKTNNGVEELDGEQLSIAGTGQFDGNVKVGGNLTVTGLIINGTGLPTTQANFVATGSTDQFAVSAGDFQFQHTASATPVFDFLNSNNVTTFSTINAGSISLAGAMMSKSINTGALLTAGGDPTSFSILGSQFNDGPNNTRIIVSGYQRTANPGGIEYISSASGKHFFYGAGPNANTGIIQVGQVLLSGNADALLVAGNGTVDFGYGQSGKETNAGRIGYQTFTPGFLDIIGAGTTSTTRQIKLYDNVTVANNLTIGGIFSPNSISSGPIAATTLSVSGATSLAGLTAGATTLGTTSTQGLSCTSVSCTGAATLNGLSAGTTSLSALSVSGSTSLANATITTLTGTTANVTTVNATTVNATNVPATGLVSATSMLAAQMTLSGNADALLVAGNGSIDFGFGQAGKEMNAGRMGYQTFTSGFLDIIGAGTTSTTRQIKLWDNVTVANNLNVLGTFTCASFTSSGTTTGAITATTINANSITLTGNSSVGGNESVTGTLRVTGSTTLTGLTAGTTSLGVTTAGATTLASGTVTGNLSVGGTSTTTGQCLAAGFSTQNNLFHATGDTTSYSCLGSNTNDGPNNTRIIVSGYQRAANAGGIEYIASSTGLHSFTGVVTTNQSLINGGFDFILGTADQNTRGNSGTSRALSKSAGNVLKINNSADFTGGTTIDSNTTVTGFVNANSFTAAGAVTAASLALTGNATMTNLTLANTCTALSFVANGTYANANFGRYVQRGYWTPLAGLPIIDGNNYALSVAFDVPYGGGQVPAVTASISSSDYTKVYSVNIYSVTSYGFHAVRTFVNANGSAGGPIATGSGEGFYWIATNAGADTY